MITKEELIELINRNKKLLIQELRENKELLKLLSKSTHRKLNDDEKVKVKKQLFDILKGIPAFAIFMLPGGLILLPLFMKLIPRLLPSVFKDDNKKINNKYIALLRGINVSGQKKILMADLRELLSDYNDVKTYIQSGNIIFESDAKNVNELEQYIKDKIYKKYGFEVPVIVKTFDEWEQAFNNNPFLSDTSIDIKQLYVTFLSEIPSEENIEIMNQIDFSPDEFIIQNNLIYSRYPNGSGRSKMTNNNFEKKLKVSATSRNWNTVTKLLALSSPIT